MAHCLIIMNLLFFQDDNTFTVRGLQPGSYLVEVVNADFFYEPVRVDITSKGKIRARKVNNVQPTQVNQVLAPSKACFGVGAMSFHL